MNSLLLSILFLGQMTVTSYRSVPRQTDNTPNWSSIGVHTNPSMIAVSQDLLDSGQIHYGDIVYVESIGFKVVQDCMNKKIKKQFDVWVETYEQEKKFDKAFRGKKLRIWVIRRK